jgi:hypothetical protein
MFISKTLNFYKREDIRNEIVRVAQDKEIAIKFGENGFGKRPEIIQYVSDILDFAKKGATSFHCSEEIWHNPLQISTGLKKSDLDELRKGWDLVLDIDCQLLEYSKIAAFYAIKVLKHHGIKSITCKFSGNKGFHIAVPFESFPNNVGGKQTSDLFPEAPRRIAAYIKYLIKDPVSASIMRLEKNSFETIVKKSGKSASEIIRFELNEFGDKVEKLNAEPFLDIDTILISSRHLFRMPFSFHEKSELVSIPINIDEILSFKKEFAKPENVVVNQEFLSRTVEKNEASSLLVEAFDFEVKEEIAVKSVQRKAFEVPENAVPEEFFPPCIKRIFQGLEDGKKRSLFVLINFLDSLGWSQQQIEDRLIEWNKNNPEPLRDTYLLGQLRYKTQHKDKVPPPNCDNPAYYKGLSICMPDDFCKKIKNPLQYSKLKHDKTKKKPVKK